MANTHKQFSEFYREIKLLKSKKESMKKSKNALRKRIKDYFKENHSEYNPIFYIQGSYKIRNGIRYTDDTADLDDGVYFEREPDVTAATLQRWVYNAVDGHTEGGQIHKRKCIRVIYVNDYHIDIPVLYMTDDMNHPKLAVKDEGWIDDDPKAFVDWFKKKKDDENQLVRLSMYHKAWGNYKGHSMPTGLCMTILCQRNLSYNDREDLAMLETLQNIQSDLEMSWGCEMPVYPYDDLFRDYDDTFKRNFMRSLSDFISCANEAVNTTENKKACNLWRKHLGERFPKCKDDESHKSSDKDKAALGAIASTNKPWSGE